VVAEGKRQSEAESGHIPSTAIGRSRFVLSLRQTGDRSVLKTAPVSDLAV